MNLLAFFREYLISRDAAPSKATVKNYLADIRKFILWYELTYHTRFQAQDVTQGIIAKFREDKLARIKRGHTTSEGMAASSVERYTSSLRKFFTCLSENGIISTSPFDVPNEAEKAQEEDKWNLKAFKNFLYLANISDLTIKNYIIDIRQFLSWAEEVTQAKNTGYIVDRRTILEKLNSTIVEEYKYRLLHNLKLSPVSINRKLSSLRKYLTWASEQGLLATTPILSNIPEDKFSTKDINENQAITSLLEQKQIFTESEPQQVRENSYSSFPPLRLAQKLSVLGNGLLDILLVAPLALGAEKVEYLKWALTGKKIFSSQFNKLPKAAIEAGTSVVVDPLGKIISAAPNFKKSFYAPLSVSTEGMPLHKKIAYTMRHNRPKWYKKYHSYTFVHYVHFAVLIIFMSAVGTYLYRAYTDVPQKQSGVLAANVSPPRILSFQGRLTDSNDTPITAKTNLRFGIYNNQTASGSALLWQEVDSVTPDENGIFSVLLGNGTTIPQSLFGQNAALFVGISVGNDAELTPRQQIATVAYATNAELLQGMPAITQPNAGTSNVILALDSSGNLTIGGSASPTFQAMGGTFTLSGNTLNLTTSVGNIVVAPGGTGVISLQSPIQNLGNNNTIPGISGAVQFNDNIGIYNTGNQTSLSIYQTNSVNAIMASQSGTTIFSIAGNGIGFLNQALGIGETNPSTRLYVNSGGDSTTATFNSGVTPNTIFSFLSSGNQFASVSRNNNNDLQVTTNNTANIILTPGGNVGIGTTVPSSFFVQAAGNIGPNVDSSYNLGSSSLRWNNIYGNSFIGQNLTLSGLTNAGGVLYTNASGAVAQTNTGPIGDCLISQGTSSPAWSPCAAASGSVWSVANGSIFPIYTSADLLIGGTSTASAKFGILNVSSGTPVAYINGNLGVGTTTPGANADIVGTLRSSGLITANGGITFGSGQTLSIGSDTIGDFVGTGLQLNGSTLETTLGTTIDLTTEVIGLLPIANGGTNSTAVPSAGAIAYGTGSAYAFSSIGSAGQCLVSGGTGAPTWSTCDGANYWQLANGALSPTNTTNDILLGSSATSSALIKLGGTTNAVSYFSAGNVGIGITAPSELLHVRKDQAAATKLAIQNTNGSGQEVQLFAGDSGQWNFGQTNSDDAFKISNDTNGSLDVNTRFMINSSGNVGIGTTNPGHTLDVVGNWGGNVIDGSVTDPGTTTVTVSGKGLVYRLVATKTSGNTGNTATFNITGLPDTDGTIAYILLGAVKNVGLGTSAQQCVNLQVNSSATILASALCSATGNLADADYKQFILVRINGSWTAFNTPNVSTAFATFPDTADLAEWVPFVGEKPEPGELVSVAKIEGGAAVTKTNNEQDPSVIGIISSNPHTVMGTEAENAVRLALTGHVPVKVSTQNGSIMKGDYLTTSNIPGVAVKAVKPGTVIGKSLENYTNSDPGSIGTVTVFINTSWYDPDVYITDTGTLHIDTSTVNNPTLTKNGQEVDRIGAFREIVAAKIRSGLIQTRELAVTGMLNAGQVSAESITIAGMSLRDYILTIVEHTQHQAEVISPVDGKLAVNIISPLASDSEIALAFSKSEISVVDNAGEKVATIDNKGNASFSGTLAVKDASVAGTLKAERIETNELALSDSAVNKLRDKLGTASATIVNNITNVYQAATPSATPILSPTPVIASESGTTSSSSASQTTEADSIQSDYAPMASMSGILAYVPSLSSEFATFTKGLMSFGPTSLSDTAITGQLVINGNMILAENSMNVLGADLQIQPLRQGNVSFMSGLVKIDIEGNMSVEGNATFGKKLAIKGLLETNFVSPIPGEDLVIKLPSIGDNDQASSEFVIADASGSAKFRVNNIGDVIASGSGQFKSLAAEAFKIVRGAQADTSLTETVATASAGTAIISKHQSERTIYSPFVKEDSLIYITPNSNTEGLTPYIARQTEEDKNANTKGSFTIQIPDLASSDIKINWWIVN